MVEGFGLRALGSREGGNMREDLGVGVKAYDVGL